MTDAELRQLRRLSAKKSLSAQNIDTAIGAIPLLVEEVERARRLAEHVRGFVDEHHISEPSCVWQSDRIAEGSYDFIAKCAEIVGFYDYPEDDK